MKKFVLIPCRGWFWLDDVAVTRLARVLHLPIELALNSYPAPSTRNHPRLSHSEITDGNVAF